MDWSLFHPRSRFPSLNQTQSPNPCQNLNQSPNLNRFQSAACNTHNS